MERTNLDFGFRKEIDTAHGTRNMEHGEVRDYRVLGSDATVRGLVGLI